MEVRHLRPCEHHLGAAVQTQVFVLVDATPEMVAVTGQPSKRTNPSLGGYNEVYCGASRPSCEGRALLFVSRKVVLMATSTKITINTGVFLRAHHLRRMSLSLAGLGTKTTPYVLPDEEE